jgi:hypothetical protein
MTNPGIRRLQDKFEIFYFSMLNNLPPAAYFLNDQKACSAEGRNHKKSLAP